MKLTFASLLLFVGTTVIASPTPKLETRAGTPKLVFAHFLVYISCAAYLNTN